MKSSIKNDPKSRRDIAYYQQRYRNRVFSVLIAFIAEQAEKYGLTKKDIAERLNKDPALISRLLKEPSNLTLDTISDLLLAFNAEPEPPRIVLFKDRPTPNYIHPLMARALNVAPPASVAKVDSNATSGVISVSNTAPGVRVSITATAS